MATISTATLLLISCATLVFGYSIESVIQELPSVRESVETRDGPLRCTSTFYTASHTPWALSLKWRYNVSLHLLCRVVRSYAESSLSRSPPLQTPSPHARTNAPATSGSTSTRTPNESLFTNTSDPVLNVSVNETIVNAMSQHSTASELAAQFQEAEQQVDVPLSASLELHSSEPKFLRLLSVQNANDTLGAAGRCVQSSCSIGGLLLRAGQPLHLHVSFFTPRIGKLVLSLSACINYSLPPPPRAPNAAGRASYGEELQLEQQVMNLQLALVPVRVARIKSALDYAFELFVLLLAAMLCLYAGFGSDLRHVVEFIRGQKAVICMGLVAQNLVMPLVSTASFSFAFIHIYSRISNALSYVDAIVEAQCLCVQLAFGLVVVFGVQPDVAMGFLVACCLPIGGAGSAAPVLCTVLRGEPSLCSALSLASSLVGIVTGPVLLLLLLPRLADRTYFANAVPTTSDAPDSAASATEGTAAAASASGAAAAPPTITTAAALSSENGAHEQWALAAMRNVALEASALSAALLLLVLAAQLVRAMWPRAAEFVTDWLLEPGLLLGYILFGTIGVQVNVCASDHVDAMPLNFES